MSGSPAAVPRSPSPRLWRMRRAQVAVSAVVVALAAAVAVAAAAAGGLLALWFARNRVRAWSYTERDEFRDRPAGQAARLVGELAALSREARRRAPEYGGPAMPPATPGAPAQAQPGPL